MPVYVIRRLFRSLIVSFFISLLMLLGLTILLYKFRLTEAQITPSIYVVYIFSCMAGGFLSGKWLKTKRFIWGILVGTLYFCFLFAVSVLQERGITTDFSQVLICLGICAAGGMIGGMIS